jgi:N-acetylmuramoyl-L-alanine amidase
MSYKAKFDPGHGGTDPGAGSYNIFEKDVVLRICKYAIDHLSKYYPAIDASLTRTNDVFWSLNKRTDTANREKVDALVSVHINSAGNKSAKGFETFRYPGTKGETLRLQNCLHDAIMEVNKVYGATTDRGKKTGNLHMVRESHMPATLTENLFISNVDDNNLLKNEEYVKAVGIAHAEGVAAFFGFPIIKVGTSEPKKEETKQEAPKQDTPKDTKKYRLMTGAFKNSDDLANGIERMKKDFGWLTYEKAESLEFNPEYRIFTGFFVGKSAAETAAEKLRKAYKWTVHVIEA